MMDGKASLASHLLSPLEAMLTLETRPHHEGPSLIVQECTYDQARRSILDPSALSFNMMAKDDAQ